MKQMLCGTDQIEPQTEVVAALAQEFSNENVILIMSRNLAHMDFEVNLCLQRKSEISKVLSTGEERLVSNICKSFAASDWNQISNHRNVEWL